MLQRGDEVRGVFNHAQVRCVEPLPIRLLIHQFFVDVLFDIVEVISHFELSAHLFVVSLGFLLAAEEVELVNVTIALALLFVTLAVQ